VSFVMNCNLCSSENLRQFTAEIGVLIFAAAQVERVPA